MKKEKCAFRQKSCTYLGHVIGAEGIHHMEDKVRAVLNAPAPQNVQELRSYFGLIHYYHNLLCNLSTLLAPLHEMTRQNTKWKWGPTQQKAFDESKALLVSSDVLVHSNPELPIILSNDASPYGIGSVLSHMLPDGSDKPIAYASRSLSLHSRKEVCTAGEGGAVACFRNLKVPQVPLREGLRVANGPFAVDRAVEGRSCHLSNGQCTHPEMGTNTKQLPVPSGVQTGYKYLSCRRIESLAATRHTWTSTRTRGSGSTTYNHERHTHHSRTHR